MPEEFCITDSQDEQSIEDLFRDADQIHVPVFQREYVWKKKEFDQLKDDIRLIQDDIEKSQFLGAIVAYKRPRLNDVVGRLRTLDVVDGQQRLLTLYLLLMALVEAIAPHDRVLALEVTNEFLLMPQRRGLDVNTRVVPSYDDRRQFSATWSRLDDASVLGGQFGENPPKPPISSGTEDGCLSAQYQRLLKYVKEQLPEPNHAKISAAKKLLDVITRRLTFVHLELTDASVATKIFERLNYRGVRVGIVDLVRNDIFSRTSNDPQEATRVYREVWQPFQQSFDGRAEAFFFPYCIVHNSNTKTSELFTELRKIWGDRTPSSIIEHMVPYRKPFLAADTGTPLYSDDVNLRISRLNSMNRPSVVYPFIMSILYQLDQNRLTISQCLALLDALESFLVRRAVAGFEPTGLHKLFKGLWSEIEADPTPVRMSTVIHDRITIQWPDNESFNVAVKDRPIAKSNICKYLLVEYDRSIPGDNPSDEPTIEHVLPQAFDPNGPWANDFNDQEHKRLKDTLANLIPLSSPLNGSLQASPFSRKKPRYLDESMFSAPRLLARRYDRWTPAEIKERSEELAAWAIERWPFV